MGLELAVGVSDAADSDDDDDELSPMLGNSIVMLDDADVVFGVGAAPLGIVPTT